VSLALLGAAGWMWKRNSSAPQSETPASSNGDGDSPLKP
jgi:hypothetical protein